MQGGHIVYSVKGVDRQGTWEGKRRYKEFYELHSVLQSRWPGVFIPKVPPKKALVFTLHIIRLWYREIKTRSLLMSVDTT